MAYLQYEGVGITAMSAAVPKRIIKNREYTEVFSAQEANEIVDKTGIEERRFADAETCSSDLCFAAAEKLFAEIGATETITLNCSDLAKIEWTSLLIHNYRFVPNKISFIPRENDNIDISVEFSAENEEGNG